ncbi:MAG: DUF4113 domain-containing protein [Pyrinomonadaceae bacterium]
MPFYIHSVSVELSSPTNLTTELLAVTLDGARRAFRDGIAFRKAGIICTELEATDHIQNPLWTAERSARWHSLMRTIDDVNRRFGRDRVRFAATGYNRHWQTRAARRNPRYTTCWDEIARVL